MKKGTKRIKTLSQEEREKIEDILYFFKHHNKNLTKKQDFLIEELEELLKLANII